MEKMKCESKNLKEDLLLLLEKFMPGCIVEGQNADGTLDKKVDFDALKIFLGDGVFEGEERYEFSWIGKKKCMIDANQPIRKTLRPLPEKSKKWDETENIYIEGDNLDALKLLQESYMGKIKMIYIDPPYNTGNDFIYNDTFRMSQKEYDGERGSIDENGNLLFLNSENNGRFHSDWCSMIYPRLMLSRNLLAEDGVICISIDDNEIDNMRKICYEIFGEKNLVNCFIWNCSTAGGIRPKFASKTHEYILVFAKNKDNLKTIYAPLSGDAIKMYQQKDEKGLYRDKDFVFKNKSENINQKYEIECPDGEKVHPKEGYIYRFIRESFDAALREGMVTFKKTSTGPLLNSEGEQAHWNIYIKKYLGDAMGAPSTLIPKEMISIYNVGTQCVQNLFDGVRVFENVKPVDVITYFINMFGGENSYILDFFSGSATTAHAVMQSNIEGAKNNHFILVQLPEECSEKSEAFKAGYRTICEIGEERIRRAACQLEEQNGTVKFDGGFRVFRVDDSNMNEVYYAAGDYTQDLIAMMESNVKADRTDLDLLFGCLLEWGLPLSLPYTSEMIDGYMVHTYNDGDLIVCFQENISDNVIRTIARRKPLRAVFRDSSFVNSPSKINVGEIFKLLAPDTRIKVI